MMYDKRVLGKLLAALLIGLIGAMGTLLLLSQGASARPLMQTDADLEIAKAGSPATVIAGESLTYTLTITNSGPATATSVIVTDTLPAGVTVSSVSPECGYSGRTVTCTLGDLALDHIATPTVVVTVNSSVTGTISNSAIVTATTTDNNTGNNTASEDTTVTTEADLAVAKSASPDPVIAGAGLTYVLTITNNGPSDATGITVTDTLPSGVSFASASPGCSEAGGTITCTLGTLARGDRDGVTVIVTPTVAGVITNKSEVSANESDDTPINNTDTVTTTVNPGADLSVTKIAASDPVIAGHNLTYTLTVTNNGPSNADNVMLTDTLPTEVDFALATPAASCSYDETGHAVTCNLNTIPSDDGETVTITVGVPASTPADTGLHNVAGVTTTTSDPNTGNNTASEDTTVTTKADLAVAKSANPGTVIAGHYLTYTITITNNGPSDATGVTLTDTLPAELAFGAASAGCTYESSEHRATCNIGPLISDATATITTTGTVTSPLPNGTPLINTATIGGDQADPDAENNTAQAQTTVQSAPILSLVKRDDPELVEAGAELVYTLTFTNTGNEIATGVILTDVLDSRVAYSDADPLAQGTGRTRYWVIGDLAPGEPSHVVLTVTVASPLTNHTILTNTAWIDSVETTPLSATQQTTVTSRPVLTITKKDTPDPVDAGRSLQYMLTITNSGNENATSVTITEHYDPNVAFSFFNSSNEDVTYDSENRVFTLPMLAVDSSDFIAITVNVTDTLSVGTVLTNQATLDSDQTTPVTATAITSVTTASELTISKYDIPDLVQAGETIIYVIDYMNSASGSADAVDVVITETYDSRVTFVEADREPDEGNNVWKIGNLEVGDGGLIFVTVRVTTPLTHGTILTNVVTIDSKYTDPLSYTETTRVSSAPDLTFSATDVPDPVEAGAPLTYTLRYTNTGNANATGVVVTATLDGNVSFSSAEPSLPSGSDPVWHWNVGTIPGEGGYGEIVIHTDVTLPLTNGTKLNFAAQLADAEGDFREDTAETTVKSAPDLSLHKSDGVSNVKFGDRLTYTLAYDNSGNENAYHVTITDTLPLYVEYSGCDGCQPPGGPDPDTVVFHIAAITQTSGQVQLFVKVKDPLPAGADFVTNTARMTHRTLSDPIDVMDVDTIDTKPNLTIAASHKPSLFSPGKLMTYTVTYGNKEEHMDAGHVMITTLLPDGTDYVADPVGSGWHSSDGQTYTYAVNDLPAGSTGHTITFTVRHTDTPEISAPEYVTPFTITGDGGVLEDGDPGDNVAEVHIGVPDLTVVDFTVEPVDPLPSDVPVTFTIVLENQGTGWAWNPDNDGRYYVDVFISFVPSYPWERNSDIDVYTITNVLAPHTQVTLTLTHPGFSEEQIQEQIQAFYVKVDNYADPIFDDGRIIGWTRLWGLVPESDEMNNVGGPVDPGIYHVYLPLVVK